VPCRAPAKGVTVTGIGYSDAQNAVSERQVESERVLGRGVQQSIRHDLADDEHRVAHGLR
jgi:hypothetical protein